MKYNHINGLKVGIYSAFFPNLNQNFKEYQKKIFDSFGLEINQIEIEPNMLGRGFNSHGTLLTELSKSEDVDYLIFFDADAIPLNKTFLNKVIERVHGKNKILGIEQRTNHIGGSIPYAGPACFVISKEIYNKLGQPHYNETQRGDVAEELSHLAREKGIEVDMFKFKSCEVPLWDLDGVRKFGIGSNYEDLVYHNFEARNEQYTDLFVDKCKEVLNEYDIRIVIHSLPHEIDQLEQTLIRLKNNSLMFDASKGKFLVDVNLNLNLTDWKKSDMPQSFFVEKFLNLQKLTSTWAQTKFVYSDPTIYGCVSHRREALKNTKSKALLILDTDIIFGNNLLYLMYHASNSILSVEKYFILTPQIPKGWDNSWDALVNPKYLKDSIKSYETRDPYKYGHTISGNTVKPLDGFKFGGGWATLISIELAKFIGIPESLGHYGLEDTFIMYGANMMKAKGYQVNQYVLENEVICEDHIFRFNPYKHFLVTENKQEEFKKMAHQNFQEEINKLALRI